MAIGGDKRLTISAATWVEFDGCIWVELKLLPHEKIAFDRMWLEVPYVPARAQDYSYWIDKESGSDAGTLKGQFSEWGTGYFVKWPDDPNDMRERLERHAGRVA